MSDQPRKAPDTPASSATQADPPTSAASAQNVRRPRRPTFGPAFFVFMAMPVVSMLVAFLIAAGGAEPPKATPEPPIVNFTPFTVVGARAPDVTLQFFQPGETSNRVLSQRLGDLQGGWVMLNFWATWCEPCREEMPVLQALHEGNFERAQEVPGGVRVIAVNFRESPAAIAAFLDEVGVTLPVVLDATGELSARFGVQQLPITILIDPQGVVRYRHIGELTTELVNQYLDAMTESPITGQDE